MTSVPNTPLNDGTTIPQLGYGVFQVPEDGTYKAVSAALAAGYRHIDTAKAYGNEAGVGKAIADSGIDRGELYVTTKLWNADQGYDSTLTAFDASLGRLGLEKLDLYLIHWPVPAKDEWVNTWKAFEKLQADGRVTSIGVSNFTVPFLERLLEETTVKPVLNQIELHPRFSQSELRAFHADHDIRTQAWSPLGGQGGSVLDKPELAAIGAAHGKTPAQVVIRWHLQLGNVVIPKSATPSRIKANIDVLDFELTGDEMASIATLDDGSRVGPDPAEANFE
ncbi:aldo/keto reductase [Rhodococcus antarcticus]|uniref:Aldo/keto reductase n=1 Tax=Rhodococcus antarcticus TaxID=2987751 RepID=A0ABY6NYJ2_9NOCA|nr:aldo/keto reductase [Rhodococcus antarcticus]UZJ24201.1 aldo/keto reductase [Rhodococcus antarcticus]